MRSCLVIGAGCWNTPTLKSGY
eukprot:SAG31_NODE_4350_length_3324_cov_2.540155_2_plen_21_part_01